MQFTRCNRFSCNLIHEAIIAIVSSGEWVIVSTTHALDIKYHNACCECIKLSWSIKWRMMSYWHTDIDPIIFYREMLTRLVIITKRNRRLNDLISHQGLHCRRQKVRKTSSLLRVCDVAWVDLSIGEIEIQYGCRSSWVDNGMSKRDADTKTWT